jgi:hypothetical protein
MYLPVRPEYSVPPLYSTGVRIYNEILKNSYWDCVVDPNDFFADSSTYQLPGHASPLLLLRENDAARNVTSRSCQSAVGSTHKARSLERAAETIGIWNLGPCEENYQPSIFNRRHYLFLLRATALFMQTLHLSE